MKFLFEGKHILLGVTGSIAAYKALELAREFMRAGATVHPVLTPAGAKFVTPLSFQSICRQPCPMDMFITPMAEEYDYAHISLAQQADLAVVAPASADCLAKLATGLADDLLSTSLLCLKAPLVVAPAMNTRMWEHPATQTNVKTLQERGVLVAGPGTGELGCGDEGIGRLADLDHIMAVCGRAVTPQDLAGKNVLISGGPTREQLDPVRFFSNPSSGRMGAALAAAAARHGAAVTLIHGPMEVPSPAEVKCIPAESAAEMADAVAKRCNTADAVIMSAAVCDYRPIKSTRSKSKKTERSLSITLEPTEDILATLAGKRKRPLLVGFAAETENVVANATKKLKHKKLDLIVANQVGKQDIGFAAETNKVTLIFAQGGLAPLPMMTKHEVAERIIVEVVNILARKKRK